MPEPQPGDELVAAFTRWAAEQRSREATAGRTRERLRREEAGAAATWSGVLVDLAEQGAPVALEAVGRRRTGRIVGVGRDFCVLETPPRSTALVRLDAIAVLWPDPGGSGAGAALPAGDRDPAIDLSLLMALARLAEEHAPVGIVTVIGSQAHEVAGELLAVGEDVLTIRADPPARRLSYVPLGAVAVCELR